MFTLKKEGSPPSDAAALGYQSDRNEKMYLGVAHGEHGDVPCKVHINGDCYYAYGGTEHHASDFSWVCDPHGKFRLEMNTGSVPPDALQVGNQTDQGVMYAVITIGDHGNVPGKANERGDAHYGINLQEYETQNFYWVVSQKPRRQMCACF